MIVSPQWRLFIFFSRESKWGTLQSAGNLRCADPAEIREVLQTEFRKLRRKRAPAAGCESRKIMAHLSENPSECSVRQGGVVYRQ